jgi:hypothetical protein
MLELRQPGGALERTPDRLSPMGGGEAGYVMNCVGVTFTPEMAEGVKGHIARVTGATLGHQTGETYVNFMELDAAGEERVRAAYPPEDWERLVALKDRHDPDNLFRFNRNRPLQGAAVEATGQAKRPGAARGGRPSGGRTPRGGAQMIGRLTNNAGANALPVAALPGTTTALAARGPGRVSIGRILSGILLNPVPRAGRPDAPVSPAGASGRRAAA